MTLSPASSRGGVLTQVTKTLTNAQIKALPTAPYPEILPAPGANRMIVPVYAWAHMTWVADYTNINAAAVISLSYGDTLTSALAAWQEASGSQVSNLLADGASHFAVAGPVGIVQTSIFVSAPGQLVDDPDPVNAALNICGTNAAAGNFTGGNAGNSLKLVVLYFVADL